MKMLSTALVSALVLAGAMTAGAQTQPAAAAHANHAPPADAAAQVDVPAAAQPAVAVVERFGQALAAGDLETAASLLDPAVLILESGGAEHSRQEYLSHHAIGDAKFLKGSRHQLKSRTARTSGALAWVGSESELHASKDGKPLTLLSTETMVLSKTGAGWRIVHIHWSSRPRKAR